MCVEDKQLFLDKIVCTYMYKTVLLMYVSSNKIAHKFNRLVKSIILSCRPRDEEDRVQKYCAAVERPTCPQWCKELDLDEVFIKPD